uniref:(northern house mosquito) hypothetical protein n=1 Tax=Culex pipiens TaxID=7175 RepID=A0A8D8HI55_CULPI
MSMRSSFRRKRVASGWLVEASRYRNRTHITRTRASDWSWVGVVKRGVVNAFAAQNSSSILCSLFCPSPSSKPTSKNLANGFQSNSAATGSCSSFSNSKIANPPIVTAWSKNIPQYSFTTSFNQALCWFSSLSPSFTGATKARTNLAISFIKWSDLR